MDRIVAKLNREHRDWLELFSGQFDSDRVLPLLSGSMAPTLLPGDLLTVRPLDGNRAHVGDIVVFRDDRKLVAHRLIFAFRLFSFALYLQKGDANRMPERIEPRRIVGRVETARRDGKLILDRASPCAEMGRSIAAKALLRYLALDIPKDILKRMLGRHA
jgi:signal peptidase I